MDAGLLLQASTGSLDEFKLMRTVGVGSFARVILARHRTDNNYYAIKVLNKAKVLIRAIDLLID